MFYFLMTFSAVTFMGSAMAFVLAWTKTDSAIHEILGVGLLTVSVLLFVGAGVLEELRMIRERMAPDDDND